MRSGLFYTEKLKSSDDFTKTLEEYIGYGGDKRIKLRVKERARCTAGLFFLNF